jgi:3-methyladenine DNA glycosylase AlkD
MYKKLFTEIQNRLSDIADDKFAISTQRFFKESVKARGVKTPEVQKLARSYFKQIDLLSKSDIFKLCNDLMASDYMEDFFAACEFTYHIKNKLEYSDFKILEKFVKKYINNWAKCDTFCNHTIGTFIEKFPEIIPEIKKWSVDKNQWVRRASSVSFILLARHGKYIDDVFEIADILLTDDKDMVQKGYGWALKAASEKYPKRVYDFVVDRVNKMPRTAFRYAIEKLPTEMRKSAMAL